MKRNKPTVLLKSKKAMIIALSSVLLATPLLPIASVQDDYRIHAANTQSPALTIKNESIISYGVTRKDYVFTTTRSSKQISTDVHVIEVDLTNPYISLSTMSGKNGEVAKKTNVKTMAENTGAIAAINGDVFAMTNEGAPMGTQIRSQQLMVSPSLIKGMYAFGVTKEKKPVIDAYLFEGNVTASDGTSYTLSGINQSAYLSDVENGALSHVNRLFIYTSAWAGSERPKASSTTPTEALVIDNVVTEIVPNGTITSEIPENGYVLRGHRDAAQFITNLKVGDTVDAQYHLISQSTQQKVDPSQFEMMIGGHTLLVENGKASSFSRDISGVSGNSYTSRSAVGYSADGKKVYMVTAERAGSNTGVSLKELQTILVKLGAHKAVNLDGGGSTTMIERPLGYETLTLAHATQEGSMRAVSNGIGVYTSAPAGQLKGMIADAPKRILVGMTAKLSVRGYDTFYNPMKVDEGSTTWKSNSNHVVVAGNELVAKAPGQTEVTAVNGSVSAKAKVEVVSGTEIKSLISQSGVGTLKAGEKVNVVLKATLNNGDQYTLTGNDLAWEFYGFNGTFKEGVITVNSVNANATTGYAIVRYGDASTMIPFSSGIDNNIVENFNNVGYSIVNQVTPAEIKGSVQMVAGSTNQSSDRALQISYDFSEGTGTKASYAKLGETGRSLMAGLSGLSLDIHGDGSNNWLRAEIIDETNTLHYVDLAKSVSWNGWKNVKVDVDSSKMQGALKLRRLYVVTLDSSKGNTALSGQIAVDNIVQYAKKINQTEEQNNIIKLKLNSKQASVNGKEIVLDVAPIAKNNYTFLPIRFIAEQLGATILYDNKAKRVTVLSGSNMLEIKINDTSYVFNGQRYSTDVAPFTEGGRTLVPVRLFSEKLGYKVDYEATEKIVTIR